MLKRKLKTRQIRQLDSAQLEDRQEQDLTQVISLTLIFSYLVLAERERQYLGFCWEHGYLNIDDNK